MESQQKEYKQSKINELNNNLNLNLNSNLGNFSFMNSINYYYF